MKKFEIQYINKKDNDFKIHSFDIYAEDEDEANYIAQANSKDKIITQVMEIIYES